MWRPMWSGFFKLGMNPILCIGTFIEAAVYARSELQLKLIAADQKFDQVLGLCFLSSCTSTFTINDYLQPFFENGITCTVALS